MADRREAASSENLPAVFDADPFHPPPPPPGARGIVVKNAEGRIIAFAWVVSEIPDEVLSRRGHEFMDELEPLTRSAAALRLLR
jgi:hypothetical protein